MARPARDRRDAVDGADGADDDAGDDDDDEGEESAEAAEAEAAEAAEKGEKRRVGDLSFRVEGKATAAPARRGASTAAVGLIIGAATARAWACAIWIERRRAEKERLKEKEAESLDLPR